MIKISKKALVSTMAIAFVFSIAFQTIALANNLDSRQFIWGKHWFAMPEERNFPSLNITSYYHPFHVEREFWHGGTVSVTGASNYNFDDTEVLLRGRGNSTWWFSNAYTKRPLRLRFDTENQQLLGIPYAHRDFILLAHHFDPSLLRTEFGFYLSYLLDTMLWTPTHGQFVNLYINGNYYGVYQLTDERDLSYGRIPIVIHEDPSLSEFVLEDGFEGSEDSHFQVGTRSYEIRFPSGSGRTQAHIEYAKNFMTNVHDTIQNGTFEDILQLVDIQTLIDFYLIQEIIRNVDTSVSNSTFLSLQGSGENRRLHFGFVWDLDGTLGNTSANNGHIPTGLVMRDQFLLIAPIFQHQEFIYLLNQRFNEIYDDYIPQVIERIIYLTEQYEQNWNRNFTLHSFDNPGTLHRDEIRFAESHAEQVQILLDWLDTRLEYLHPFFQ